MALACACAAATAHATTPLVRASIDPDARATPIVRHFLGFSMSYRGLFRFTGHPMAGVNPVAVQMLANLASEAQGEPGLRLGGSSADVSWWNPAGRPQPPGVHVDLGPYTRDALVNFERATRAPLLLGVNFAANRVAYATGWARAVASALPGRTLEAIEIGNEPEAYTGFGSYLHDLQPFTRALARLPHRPALAGPGTCCGTWAQRARRLVRAQRGRIRLLTFHLAATDGCPHASARTRLTTANLLSDATLRGAAARLAAIRAAARRAHRPVRITDLSSGACDGRAGVSDTYAASLWMADWLFVLAAERFAGVNVEANGLDAPFEFGYADDHFVGHAGPGYYGMLLFARAIAHHARLLVPATLAARPRRGAAVHVWATATRSGRVRIVVVNKDTRRGGTAVISVRHGAGRARLERLTAPSLDARAGISLGGMSIPDVTTDGRLTGTPVSESVAPSGHTYRFTMPAASAALLTVPIRRARR